MLIKGKRVTLRAPELADVPSLNAWANDPALWHDLTGWHFPYPLHSTEAWVRALDPGSQTDQVFAIDAPGPVLVGTLSLRGIDWKNGTAQVGLMLGDPKSRGKGLGTDALFAIARHAFDELGLRRLDAEVIGYNEASLALFTKSCGWKVEGTRRGWFHRGGRSHDKVLLGLTREDYRAKRARYWSTAP